MSLDGSDAAGAHGGSISPDWDHGVGGGGHMETPGERSPLGVGYQLVHTSQVV